MPGVINDRVVPQEVEELFDQIKSDVGRDSVVEDSDAGLRYQWKMNWIPTLSDMQSIADRYKKLRNMIELGEWSP